MSKVKTFSAALAMSLFLSGGAVFASDYPNRTINLLVGFTAGGNIDIVARQAVPFLEKYLGGNIAVVNKAGAAGAIANQELANSPPDGYTLGLLSGPGFLTVLFGNNLQYDADSFDYLGTFSNEPYTLVVGTGTPYNTLEELVEAARAAPGTITVGGAGLGSAPHLALKVFERAADVEFNFIPSPGAADMRTQLMGGHIDAGVVTVSLSVPIDQEGQGRLLGVLGDERSAVGSEYPTARELGYDATWSALRGLGAPAGLPDDVRKALVDAVEATMKDPEFLELAKKSAILTYYADGDTFRDIVKKQQVLLNEIWDEEPWISN